MLSERSSSRRDDSGLRRPAGSFVKRFLARLSFVNAGMASKVPLLKDSRPQFAHSRRYTLKIKTIIHKILKYYRDYLRWKCTKNLEVASRFIW